MGTELLRDLMAGFSMGMAMPDIKFFQPSIKFLQWMTETFPGEHVYDVGAGCGHVAAYLAEEGFNVTALDISHRDNEEYPVEIANACTYDYNRDSVFLICRPCHGPFVEMAIERALECGVYQFVYVGLPKNRRADLGRYHRRFTCLVHRVGDDNENVYAWM